MLSLIRRISQKITDYHWIRLVLCGETHQIIYAKKIMLISIVWELSSRSEIQFAFFFSLWYWKAQLIQIDFKLFKGTKNWNQIEVSLNLKVIRPSSICCQPGFLLRSAQRAQSRRFWLFDAVMHLFLKLFCIVYQIMQINSAYRVWATSDKSVSSGKRIEIEFH